MKNILILGCGYVGSALAKTLHEKGYQVETTTRSPQKVEILSTFSDKVHLIENLDDRKLAPMAANKDAIFLTVAPSYSFQNNTETYQETYLNTAKALLNTLQALQAKCQLIYTSSTSVYNGFRSEARVVTEDLLLSPVTEEAMILLETENTLLQYLNTCILRLSEILGPDRELYRRLAKMTVPLPGSGDNITNAADVRDIVKALQLVLEKQLNGIYNICNDEHPKRKDLYEQICMQHHLPMVQWDPKFPSRHGGLYTVSNQKIKGEGMVFNYSLDS